MDLHSVFWSEVRDSGCVCVCMSVFSKLPGNSEAAGTWTTSRGKDFVENRFWNQVDLGLHHGSSI